MRRSVSRSSVADTPPSPPASAFDTAWMVRPRSAIRSRASVTSTTGCMPSCASRTSESDGKARISDRAESAQRDASSYVRAESSTRTIRPSRPIRLPNSDAPATSRASIPWPERSGNAARIWSANPVACRPAGTGRMSCAVADVPGSAPARISSSVAVPTRVYTSREPNVWAASSSRFACRVVSSIAVPSTRFSEATTMRSLDLGQDLTGQASGDPHGTGQRNPGDREDRPGIRERPLHATSRRSPRTSDRCERGDRSVSQQVNRESSIVNRRFWLLASGLWPLPYGAVQ